MTRIIDQYHSWSWQILPSQYSPYSQPIYISTQKRISVHKSLITEETTSHSQLPLHAFKNVGVEVWFCLQDSSSTQDLHLECQRGNSGIQWLSGLLWCFFDFDAAACFLPSIVNHCMVHVEWSCLSTSKPSRLLDISTTLTAPTALIHFYCFLKYDYIISRWITEYQ